MDLTVCSHPCSQRLLLPSWLASSLPPSQQASRLPLSWVDTNLLVPLPSPASESGWRRPAGSLAWYTDTRRVARYSAGQNDTIQSILYECVCCRLASWSIGWSHHDGIMTTLPASHMLASAPRQVNSRSAASPEPPTQIPSAGLDLLICTEPLTLWAGGMADLRSFSV